MSKTTRKPAASLHRVKVYQEDIFNVILADCVKNRPLVMDVSLICPKFIDVDTLFLFIHTTVVQ